MPSLRPNHVRQQRLARGLTQLELASAASLSRQSIHAIEAGRATPAVDVALRLAGALECAVEALFGRPIESDALRVEASDPSPGGRLALAHIAGRWISYPIEGLRQSADAIALRAGKRTSRVELLRSVANARDNVIVMGCAPGLGVLTDWLNAQPGPGRFLWLPRTSTRALTELAAARTHLAGVHLVDAATGEANLPDIRRISGSTPRAIVTLARWEAGIVTATGNPKRLRRVADLGRRGIRLATREAGSGARRLFERELAALKLPARLAREGAVSATGHLEVAQAVSLGAADAGIATRDAALVFGLDFVPLAEERYDLALDPDEIHEPRLQRLFDAITSRGFRRELSSLGYDTRECGNRVA